MELPPYKVLVKQHGRAKALAIVRADRRARKRERRRKTSNGGSHGAVHDQDRHLNSIARQTES